jgi:CheY-like chemotaxis protein
MKKINCILLIDDNQADNEFHRIKIMKADVCNNIKIVTNGQMALDYLIKSGEPGQQESYPKPDLIFLDINMPGMNGFEFLEEYKKLDQSLKSKVVIIMLTTSLNPDDKERALATNEVTDFQNKPLTIEGLHEILKSFFNS